MKTENENRSKHVALALETCAHCQGSGMSSPEETCCCVLRKIFRAVMKKFRECAAGAGHLQPIIMDGSNAPRYRRASHVRKREEFTADCWLTAARTLTDPAELNLFKYHYLLGADWKLCTRQLGIDRGNFYHAAYRIEQKLGKVFQELKPYALFPTDEYFQVVVGRYVDTRPTPIPDALYPNGVPLQPPLAPRPVATPALDPFEAVKEEIRAAFSQGQTLTAIANDLNRRGVLPKRASRWYPAIVQSITGTRAEACAPEPVPVNPAPAPVATPAPFDIADGAAIANYVRKDFRAGCSLNFLAAQLTRLNVPAPKGTAWRECDLKRLLPNHPRETARSKRAA